MLFQKRCINNNQTSTPAPFESINIQTTREAKGQEEADTMDPNVTKGCTQSVEALRHGWSNLNMSDIHGETTSSPSTDDLIQRNVDIIEAHLLKVMEWRQLLVRKHLHTTGHSYRMSPKRTEDQTSCVNTKMDMEISQSFCSQKETSFNDSLTSLSLANSKIDMEFSQNLFSQKEPSFNDNSLYSVPCNQYETEITKLSDPVRSELHLFVSTVASNYNKVLYHNFEHASHVTACANQLVTMLGSSSENVHEPFRRYSGALSLGSWRSAACASNVSAPADGVLTDSLSSSTAMSGSSGGVLRDSLSSSTSAAAAGSLLDNLCTSPMVHLAIVLSALIHDVEHQGVGNKQLVNESDPLAIKYKGKSVAENNSFDSSLELLQQQQFQKLRNCIFGDIDSLMSELPPDARECKLLRNKIKQDIESYTCLFHRMCYDVVMATDISSPDRLESGRLKWIEAFEEKSISRFTCGSVYDGSTRAKSQPRRLSFPPITRDKRRMRSHSIVAPSEFIADPFPEYNVSLSPKRSHSWSRNMCSFSDETINCPFCASSCASSEAFRCISYIRVSSTLEQIIQASDVGHTMQSWPVFMKWNEKLYNELWAARNAARGPDCSNQWFDGQISFFDGYILPLARRLKQCGIFGDLGGVFYDNVCSNRERWILEGRDLCRQMYENASRSLI